MSLFQFLAHPMFSYPAPHKHKQCLWLSFPVHSHTGRPGSTHLQISIWLRLWLRARGNSALTRLTAGRKLTRAPRSFRFVHPHDSIFCPRNMTRIARAAPFIVSVTHPGCCHYPRNLLKTKYTVRHCTITLCNISWVFALTTQGWSEQRGAVLQPVVDTGTGHLSPTIALVTVILIVIAGPESSQVHVLHFTKSERYSFKGFVKGEDNDFFVDTTSTLRNIRNIIQHFRGVGDQKWLSKSHVMLLQFKEF